MDPTVSTGGNRHSLNTTKTIRLVYFHNQSHNNRCWKTKQFYNLFLCQKWNLMGTIYMSSSCKYAPMGVNKYHGIDFDCSWLLVVGASALWMTLLWVTVEILCLAILDIENCFQNTLMAAEDQVVVTLPNFYMKWYKREYPEYVLDESPSNRYVAQAPRGLQGNRAIRRKFYLTTKILFAKFGMFPYP